MVIYCLYKCMYYCWWPNKPNCILAWLDGLMNTTVGWLDCLGIYKNDVVKQPTCWPNIQVHRQSKGLQSEAGSYGQTRKHTIQVSIGLFFLWIYMCIWFGYDVLSSCFRDKTDENKLNMWIYSIFDIGIAGSEDYESILKVHVDMWLSWKARNER